MKTKKAFYFAIRRAKPRLAPQVRSILDASGWPIEITAQITLAVQGESIGLYIPAEIQEQVDELEYGSLKTPPSWVIRRIDELVDRVVGEEVQDEYVNFIFSEDVLL